MNIGMYVSNGANVITKNSFFVSQNLSRKSGDCVEKSGGRETYEKSQKIRRSPDKSGDMESLILVIRPPLNKKSFPVDCPGGIILRL